MVVGKVLVAKNYTVSWVGSPYLIGDGLEYLLALCVNKLTPVYLYEHPPPPPPSDVSYNLRHRGDFQNDNMRTERYRNSFFPYCISEWENLVMKQSLYLN